MLKPKDLHATSTDIDTAIDIAAQIPEPKKYAGADCPLRTACWGHSSGVPMLALRGRVEAVVLALVLVLGGSTSGRVHSADDAPSSIVNNVTKIDPSVDVSECILLFGAFCNGNLGDVIQASTMSRLVAKVATEDRCVWHAHPSKEDAANGFREGEFFANNSAGIIALGCDRDSGEQVSRFKGFIIGGGGLLEARHWPLDCEAFVEGLGTDIPVAILGVGASAEARDSAPIVRRADYISGRDAKSVNALSTLLEELENARVKPHKVARVRDPVLSDSFFQDVDGSCWRQSKGHPSMKPLCFVLPSALTEELQMLHLVYATKIVRNSDVLLNVFPKHQAEIEAFPYPVEVQEVLDPADFASRLCGCRAVVSSRLHGTIIALQAGVPTLAAWPSAAGNKVPDLMNDVIRFSDQFVQVDESMTRVDMVERVDIVRKAYERGRRLELFKKLDTMTRYTEAEMSTVLEHIFHLSLPKPVRVPKELSAGGFWKEPTHARRSEHPEIEVVHVMSSREAEARNTTDAYREEIVMVDQEVRHPDTMVILPRWKKWAVPWGLSGETAPPEVTGEVSFAGSLVMSLGTLLMIVLLGLPPLASRPKSVASSPAGQEPELPQGQMVPEILEGGGPVATRKWVGPGGTTQVSAADAMFFGFNYILWVVLAMGFNVCSKTYMRETRNPMALLTIQGWVGVVILSVLNGFARCRKRRCSPVSRPSSVPATPPWLGKCGLMKARRVAWGVWQAGLLHSCNAVLTSWSVLVGGVAATHALKALEPVAAAGFSRWLLGSTLPPGRAAAVAIIVLGLTILMAPIRLPGWAGRVGALASSEDSSVSEPGLDLVIPSLVTACACCAVALRNVLLKKQDPAPPPPPLGLLVCSIVGAAVGSAALLVPWLPCSWEWAGKSLLRASGINAALCFVGYNLASFNLLSELSPVGHAVGNASKRVCLFATGLFMLGEEGSMTPRQLIGASVAFLGLASYNLAGSFASSVAASSR